MIGLNLLVFSTLVFLLAIVVILVLWFRSRSDSDEKVATIKIVETFSHLEHSLRDEFSNSVQIIRSDLTKSQENLRESLLSNAQNARIESAEVMSSFSNNVSTQIHGLIEINDRRVQEIRDTLEKRLQLLQVDNSNRLDEMRKTVDEKLHITLEQRLGESFKLVSERLEAVHKGLGEMRNLAVGVGDLKRVLSNVKSRGVWGEVQLERLIEDNMTIDQYGRNVKPIPGSDAVVEFAIRLPGKIDDDIPVWLPIDSKFPKEEYEKLCDIFEQADSESIKIAMASLARAVEIQGRLIASKYVSPPYTTDFAIMFLPTEGLYAEVLRCPGLLDKLHNVRINVAGPSNLAALLNSLQMGFRTLTIERRSSEVWQILRAVKTEFGKFGESLASVKKTLETASSKLGQTEVRSRAMLRNLKTLEVIPDNVDVPAAQKNEYE